MKFYIMRIFIPRNLSDYDLEIKVKKGKRKKKTSNLVYLPIIKI